MKIKTQLIALGKYESNNIHEDNVGVDRIASFLCKKGFPTHIDFLYTNSIDEAVKKIDLECNFFGITLHSDNVLFVFQLAEKIKQISPQAVVFVGGIFATYAAKEVLKNSCDIDFVVLGHGDIPLSLLYQEITLRNGDISAALLNAKYIYARNNNNQAKPCYSDINLHALPERKYLNHDEKTVVCIIGSHGCYGNCSFCTVPEPGALVTERNINDIFSEIEEIHKKQKISFFYFLDAAIEGWGEKGKERLISFCEMVEDRKMKLSFRAFLRAESFKHVEKDVRLLKKMKSSGFVNIIIGIEAGNDNDLKIYNKICNIQDVKECLSLFDEINYDIILGYIILNPYTSYSDLKSNYYLLSSTKFSLLHNYINCLQVNFNTPIYNRLEKDGLLLDKSIFSSGYDYKCCDQSTQQIFTYLKKYFLQTDVMQRDFMFNNQLNHIQYMLNVLDEVDTYKNLLCEIRGKINILCAEYFKIIFINMDFNLAIDKYNDFICQIYKNYDQVASINNALLKKYLKTSER